MRVFVAGATGVIGRSLVPKLVEAGHEVTGMTRTPAKVDALRAQGAEPVVCDALDAEAVHAVVAAARPEVLVHELTDLPPALPPRKMEALTASTSRLRRDGTRHLLDAARGAGTKRIVAQSIAFAYAAEGDRVKTEEAPLMSEGPAAAIADMERMLTTADGIEAVILRYGFFYGPGTSYAADGSVADDVRRRRFPVVGNGAGTFSFVDVDDAAAATVLAVDQGGPGIYNVADGEPAPVRDWLPAYAAALGAPPPRRVPAWLARIVAGRVAVAAMTGLRGADSAKARGALGWQPRHASWREGFRAGLG